VAEKSKVSVVLGGGGAKGFVHAGVLDALDSRGYEIVAMFGTSIGAILASVFAYHRVLGAADDWQVAQRHAVNAVKTVLLNTNFLDLIDANVLSPFRRGFIKGHKVRDRLEVLLMHPQGTASVTFGDLKPFDLNVTFTDASNGDSLVANATTAERCSVAAAVRASLSIQGVFLEETIDYQDRKVLCWDGGVTGNCRFDLSARKYPELLTVASSVTYSGKPRELPSSFLAGFVRPVRVFTRSADFWLRQIENLTADLLGKAMDRVVIVRPEIGDVTTLKFWVPRRMRELLFENGRREAEKQLQAYEGLT
jgi:NTE family protein